MFERIHFSSGGARGNSALTIAALLQRGASLFLFYYSLLFDDSPAPGCQGAGGGAGLGAGRIYCHDGGDRLHRSVPSTACSVQRRLRARPTTSASKSKGEKSPKISSSRGTAASRCLCQSMT